MAIDLKHMLKVYNYVNDEKRPKVNLKFLGVFVALVVALAALVAFSAQVRPAADDSVQSSARTEYVGLSPTEIAAGAPASVAASRLEAWQAHHPDADTLRIERIYDDGRLVGYAVTYRE